MIVYVENLKVISNSSKFPGYKVNIQKPTAFLYTPTMNCYLKLKTQYHLHTLAPPKMKYLGINLINYVQDLYKKNYKTLMRNQRRTK